MSRQPTVADLLAAAARADRLAEVHRIVVELLGADVAARGQRELTRRLLAAGTKRWR